MTALNHLEMAAVARGIGTCHAGFLVAGAEIHEPLQKLLGVPDGHVVCAALLLGWGQYTYKRIPARKPAQVSWR